MRVARERIDLTRHQGEHPRMGATDVVPFIPVEGVTWGHRTGVLGTFVDLIQFHRLMLVQPTATLPDISPQNRRRNKCNQALVAVVER